MSAALLTLCRDLDDVQACPLLGERLRQVADRVVDSLPGLTSDDLAQLRADIAETDAEDYSGHVFWVVENIISEQFSREVTS